MSDNPVSAYLNLGDPTDSYQPGDGKQLVDLDEYYQETDQPETNAMVQGSESLGLGYFHRSLAIKLGLKDANKYDPVEPHRNLVAGTEGFFSTLYEGFKKMIENIIKYIRMGCDWVANQIKGLLGFRKSKRIESAINASFDNLRTEFKETLKSLGFQSDKYNLETFIGEFPAATDRVGQLTIMRSRFETDADAIKGLASSLPLFQQAVGKLTECSNKATRAVESFKRVIKDEYNRTRARAHVGQPLAAAESPEVNRMIKAALEVRQSLGTDALLGEVLKLLETLYKVQFVNPSLTEGFSAIRKQVDEQVAVQTSKLTPVSMNVIMTNIQHLNNTYVTISDNSIDMSGINIRSLGNVIDKTDAEKALAIANYYGAPGVLQSYQETAVAVRNYTDFCQAVSKQLLLVHHQVENLVGWHHRCHLWYYHGLLGDAQKIAELSKQARQSGHNPFTDANGNITYPMDFIPEADAKTFMEKFSGTMHKVIEEDIGGLKTTYNAFVKQSGWGKTA